MIHEFVLVLLNYILHNIISLYFILFKTDFGYENLLINIPDNLNDILIVCKTTCVQYIKVAFLRN